MKPMRRKKSRRGSDNENSFHLNSPEIVPVPFNSPDNRPGSLNRKKFQPMNLDEKTRKKKEKRRKRKEEMRLQQSINEPKKTESQEYFKTKVQVTPLNFSDKNYKKNYVTETLFAGSLHLGYRDNTDQQAEAENVKSDEKFTSWRELFDEKMKTES